MGRFIDDIRRVKRFSVPWFIQDTKLAIWADHTARVASILREEASLPVILADNVAQYYWEASGQEYWDLTKDFPNLAPPYPMFWIEHKFPKKIHSDEKGDVDMAAKVPNGRVGALLIGSLAEFWREPDSKQKYNLLGTIPEAAHWILIAELFIDYGFRGDVDGPVASFMLAVDQEGQTVEAPQVHTYSASEHNNILQSMMTWLHPALLTMCFLHCKNVTVTENQVPEKLAKKYQKHYGLAPTNYKTLVIEPLKQILHTQGRSGEVGVAKAMHICRGHFKDYRQGKGLFGKYHMMVWQDALVRGTRGEKAPPREINVKV